MVLVLSDSHRMLKNMNKVFETLAERLDVVIHLGDNVGDVSAFEKMHPNIVFHKVLGNCDFGYGDSYEDEYGKLISINSKRIFITHGHRLNVKDGLQRLVYTAEEKEADVCLYGHTHMSNLFIEGKTVFMNPGSISDPRGGDTPSYGVIEFKEVSSYISVVSANRTGYELKYSLPL